MHAKHWLWLLGSLREYRWHLIALLCSSALLGTAGAIGPMFLQQLVDDAASGRLNALTAALFVGALLVSALPLSFVLRDRLRSVYRYHLRIKILQHLLRMDLAFHEERGSTTVTTQAAKGVSACADIVGMLGNGQILVHLPIAVFSAMYIAHYSVVAAAMLVAFLTLFVIAGQVVGGKLSDTESKYHDIDTELTHRQRESLHQITAVKTHHAEHTEVMHHKAQGRIALLLRNRLTHLYALFSFLGQGANSFAGLVVIVLFLPQVVDGLMTMGTFFALMMYAGRVLQPATFIGDFYAEIKRAGAMVVPLIEMFDEEPHVVEQSHALDLNAVRYEIRLEDVSFSYPHDARPVLHHVSLVIPAHKKTAIVGPSGSGKTTLARLMMRLYDADEGLITYDGTDVRMVSFESLYREIAYLPQEVPIFSGTIEDNVAFGVDDYTRADLLGALKHSSAEFALEHEGGISQKIGELGKKLSGGERQRIALARIFMRNPSVVVLDEATSALDTVTESRVHERIDNLAGGRTMVVIAHRLTTVQNADQIVVVDKGSVVDVGTHRELLDRCALYRNLNSTFVHD